MYITSTQASGQRVLYIRLLERPPGDQQAFLITRAHAVPIHAQYMIVGICMGYVICMQSLRVAVPQVSPLHPTDAPAVLQQQPKSPPSHQPPYIRMQASCPMAAAASPTMTAACLSTRTQWLQQQMPARTILAAAAGAMLCDAAMVWCWVRSCNSPPSVKFHSF
jgi:hypothetical protein